MVQTKALYNMLRMSAAEDPSFQVEPWAIEDLRVFPLDQLWVRLGALGIRLDKDSFIQFSEEADSPEDLTEVLVDEEQDPAIYDQCYLLIFELWRRLIPTRASLSIFADEFDYQIHRFDQDEMDTDEPIQDALARLSEILEEQIDAKVKPKDAFAMISDHCAHDLENFLYDYISDLLDQQNYSYTQELLDEFAGYFPKSSFFELLQARLLNRSDAFEANRKFEAILAKKPELPLLFDLLETLVACGQHELFNKAMRQIIPQIHLEEQLVELLDLAADYYTRLDKEAKEAAVQQIKATRISKPTALRSSDPAIAQLKELFS